MKTAYPDINICVTILSKLDIFKHVNEGLADVGFFIGSIFNTPFATSDILFESELCFCKHTKNISDSVMFCDDDSIKELQKKAFIQNNILFKNIYCTAKVSVILDLVRLGYGNVCLPKNLLDFIDKKRIINLSHKVDCNGIMLKHNNYSTSTKVSDFINIIKKYLKSYPDL